MTQRETWEFLRTLTPSMTLDRADLQFALVSAFPSYPRGEQFSRKDLAWYRSLAGVIVGSRFWIYRCYGQEDFAELYVDWERLRAGHWFGEPKDDD